MARFPGILLIWCLWTALKMVCYASLLDQLEAVQYPQLDRPRSRFVSEKIHDRCLEMLSRPPYAPDLTPRDYSLFSNLENRLAQWKFTPDGEVIVETKGNVLNCKETMWRNKKKH